MLIILRQKEFNSPVTKVLKGVEELAANKSTIPADLLEFYGKSKKTKNEARKLIKKHFKPDMSDVKKCYRQ